MDDTTLLQLVTGPTSSLILVLMAMGALWRFFHTTVVPAVSRWVDAHLAQVDRLMPTSPRSTGSLRSTARTARRGSRA
jgi:hypothetical protein